MGLAYVPTGARHVTGRSFPASWQQQPSLLAASQPLSHARADGLAAAARDNHTGASWLPTENRVSGLATPKIPAWTCAAGSPKAGVEKSLSMHACAQSNKLMLDAMALNCHDKSVLFDYEKRIALFAIQLANV